MYLLSSLSSAYNQLEQGGANVESRQGCGFAKLLSSRCTNTSLVALVTMVMGFKFSQTSLTETYYPAYLAYLAQLLCSHPLTISEPTAVPVAPFPSVRPNDSHIVAACTVSQQSLDTCSFDPIDAAVTTAIFCTSACHRLDFSSFLFSCVHPSSF